ncbi:lipo-like protein [Vibrio anguillarum]|uniref:Lipo-like protein n=1 Tax=Vibrio anguillarum TaxID=55601 RepID=A0A289GDD3_VIBAN|nr:MULTISPECIES: YbaY family lipoprotein [Vibrio]ASW81436.1 lipo-like protein [Vibrio anguillarum]AXN03647.1 lipo-like protein [Vibrio anguillarum]AZS24008.1 lipo-like protein [Vibrio anguillarum]MBF4308665.1 lipo-like protein [Vibrio anguillarum]MBF4325429.1 lipo-like protein [Vibrio anguillarum]
MKKALLLIMSSVLGLMLVGCQSAQKPTSSESNIQSIMGTVSYRERIALPDKALVTITLQDVSLADAPAKVIAKHRFETNGMQVPLEFDLAFDNRKIDAHHRYSVSARIEVDGKLRFITDTHYAVITDENNTKRVDLRLVGVKQ